MVDQEEERVPRSRAEHRLGVEEHRAQTDLSGQVIGKEHVRSLHKRVKHARASGVRRSSETTQEREVFSGEE